MRGALQKELIDLISILYFLLFIDVSRGKTKSFPSFQFLASPFLGPRSLSLLKEGIIREIHHWSDNATAYKGRGGGRGSLERLPWGSSKGPIESFRGLSEKHRNVFQFSCRHLGRSKIGEVVALQCGLISWRRRFKCNACKILDICKFVWFSEESCRANSGESFTATAPATKTRLPRIWQDVKNRVRKRKRCLKRDKTYSAFRKIGEFHWKLELLTPLLQNSIAIHMAIQSLPR